MNDLMDGGSELGPRFHNYQYAIAEREDTDLSRCMSYRLNNKSKEPYTLMAKG